MSIWRWLGFRRARYHFWFLIALLLSVDAAAQVRPGNFSTLNTTDTTADSVHVGCAVGSSSCTGGVKAGPVDVSQVVTAGAITIASNVPGVTTNKLYNNGGTLTWNGSPLAAGGAVGPGTAGKLAKFTAANAVGDSICTEAGATITCVNTIAATTGTFTTLTGTLTAGAQNNITTINGATSASSLVTVGTIGTGVWNATVIGIAKGGTGVDLSATGGTSQFLRQNGVGATVTVVRPAVADLSDSATLAFLAAANLFTGNTNASYLQTNTNSSTGTASIAGWSSVAGTTTVNIEAMSQGYTTSGPNRQGGGAIRANGTGGLALAAINAAGSLLFYSGGTTLRWGIDAAGNMISGSAGNIALSNGTPTFSTCSGGAGCTTAGLATGGTDYNQTWTPNNNGTSLTVNFGHTFTNAPACTANSSNPNAVAVTASTTQVTVATSGGAAALGVVTILCLGG